MRDRKTDRHRVDTDTITIWVPKTLKERIKREAKEARLPSWGLSRHITYELLALRGLWDEPYHPSNSNIPLEEPTQFAPRKLRRG